MELEKTENQGQAHDQKQTTAAEATQGKSNATGVHQLHQYSDSGNDTI